MPYYYVNAKNIFGDPNLTTQHNAAHEREKLLEKTPVYHIYVFRIMYHNEEKFMESNMKQEYV